MILFNSETKILETSLALKLSRQRLIKEVFPEFLAPIRQVIFGKALFLKRY